MQAVGAESIVLPTATAGGAWQVYTTTTAAASLSGRTGAEGGEQGESRHGMAGETGQRNNLLEGKLDKVFFFLIIQWIGYQ